MQYRDNNPWSPSYMEPAVIVQPAGSGSGVLVFVVAMTASLAGGLAWLLKSQPLGNNGNNAKKKSPETMYADTVASLEAQLHRLSVDRQMLADEFAAARQSLETEVASVVESRDEATSALERSETAAREARASVTALAERLKAEVALTERLRDEKAKAEANLDTLKEQQRRVRFNDSMS